MKRVADIITTLAYQKKCANFPLLMSRAALQCSKLTYSLLHNSAITDPAQHIQSLLDIISNAPNDVENGK